MFGLSRRSRAAAIVRGALGEDYDRAVKAFRSAPVDVTAAQALAAAGVNACIFMGLAAACEPYAAGEFRRKVEQQAARRQGWLDRLAGGSNTTSALIALGQELEALRVGTAAMRQEALDAIDAPASLEVKTAAEALRVQASSPGVRATADSDALVEIANELERLTAVAGGVPIAIDIYEFRRTVVDDIITRSIAKASAGWDVCQQEVERALKMVARKLEEVQSPSATSNADEIADYYSASIAYIMADALSSVRNGVFRDEVRWDALDEVAWHHWDEDEYGPNGSTRRARFRRLAREVQLVLDSALSAAGGDAWHRYLDACSQGSRALERKAMMVEAARRLRLQPQRFLRLVRGNDLEAVLAVSGERFFCLKAMMNPAEAGPSPMDALKTAAAEVERDQLVAKQASMSAYPAQGLWLRGVEVSVLAELAHGFLSSENMLQMLCPSSA